MESHIDKLLHSIKSLPLEDKVKILYFLELETFESKPGEKEIVPFVYPKRINNINGGNGWTEMYLDFFTDVIAWLTEYYQRVHCESFHSAFKRVYGILTKINTPSKFVQVTARIILHNRARLSYFSKAK